MCSNVYFTLQPPQFLFFNLPGTHNCRIRGFRNRPNSMSNSLVPLLVLIAKMRRHLAKSTNHKLTKLRNCVIANYECKNHKGMSSNRAVGFAELRELLPRGFIYIENNPPKTGMIDINSGAELWTNRCSAGVMDYHGALGLVET